jgi:hypothetical protein
MAKRKTKLTVTKESTICASCGKKDPTGQVYSDCCEALIINGNIEKEVKQGRIPRISSTRDYVSSPKSKSQTDSKRKSKSVDPTSGIRTGTAKYQCYLIWSQGVPVDKIRPKLEKLGFVVGGSSIRSWCGRFDKRYKDVRGSVK